jgi:hypothetical protein
MVFTEETIERQRNAAGLSFPTPHLAKIQVKAEKKLHFQQKALLAFEFRRILPQQLLQKILISY